MYLKVKRSIVFISCGVTNKDGNPYVVQTRRVTVLKSLPCIPIAKGSWNFKMNMDETQRDLEREPLIQSNSRSDTYVPVRVFQRSAWARITMALRGKERLWPCVLAAVVSSLSTLLGGYALGYSSSALLELGQLPGELSFNGSVMQGVFGVSVSL